ncbi:lema family protein [Comamonadaceae bacterium OTU4NAUVB1]|nr:lema family protein [Comamonadaceae bacterium OTU4NAUVB1]
MIHVPESFGYWVGAAVLLFWFVGAYNRLVRLRSATLQAYAVLDAALVRQLDFVQAQAVAALATHAGTAGVPREASVEASGAHVAVTVAPGPGAAAYVSLKATTTQLSTLLATTRLRPLDGQRMAALDTALHVMLGVWQALHPDAVVRFATAAVGEEAAGLPIAWPEPSPDAEVARGQFNLAVANYNRAIRQFPAVLVAWVMRMQGAAPLR